ncbi:MAG: Gldg family protein [Desulfosudis oleivorans]|nr:Gldg family protein [Desulfosudis oleivorans]
MVEYGDRKITLPLIDVVRMPIIGTQYKLVEHGGPRARMINSSVESLIDIHSRLGFLADRGAAPLAGGAPGSRPAGRPAGLRQPARARLAELRLDAGGAGATAAIPEGIACLLIVKPREKFSDYDLYQIDQFLMQGKSLALFVDAFEEIQMPGQAGLHPDRNRPGAPAGALRGEGPARLRPGRELLPPGDAGPAGRRGAADLLRAADQEPVHRPGARLHAATSRGLVAVKASPAGAAGRAGPREQPEGLPAARLLGEVLGDEGRPSTSTRSTLRPPAARPRRCAAGRSPTCWRARFPSYFAGKPLPVRQAGAEEGGRGRPPPAAGAPPADRHRPDRTPGRSSSPRASPASIFVMASSEMLRRRGHRRDRPRAQHRLRPQRDRLPQRPRGHRRHARQGADASTRCSETSAGAKAFIKSFAIAGLPLLVALFGVGVWFCRTARKKRIQRNVHVHSR